MCTNKYYRKRLCINTHTHTEWKECSHVSDGERSEVKSECTAIGQTELLDTVWLEAKSVLCALPWCFFNCNKWICLRWLGILLAITQDYNVRDIAECRCVGLNGNGWDFCARCIVHRWGKSVSCGFCAIDIAQKWLLQLNERVLHMSFSTNNFYEKTTELLETDQNVRDHYLVARILLFVK